ncbi:MAG: hypothetical protein LBI36_06665 [Oscillospiraceae bacterium]|jgi:hypothetical protein|nr:hypothetical protein [Oscillospiraceae bacterium]
MANFVGTREKRTAKRLAVSAVCILFVVGIFFSTAFVFAHINHEHVRLHGESDAGNACAVCLRLTAIIDLLKAVSAASVCAALALGVFRVVRRAPKPVGFRAGFRTLVCLKVRIDN